MPQTQSSPFLADLTLPELQSLAGDRTVVILPVGWTESVGPHLALGTGASLAQALALQLRGKLEKEEGVRAFMAPVFPFALEGSDKTATTVRGHVLRDWLVDQIRSLGHHGFKNFICVSTHLGPRTLTAIEEAAWTVMRRGRMWGWAPRSNLRLLPLSSAVVTNEERRRSFLKFRAAADYGAQVTSAALARSPAGVRDFYRELPGLHDASATHGAEFEQRWLVAHWDNVKQFLSGRRRWTRSGYGIYPWNWSFFKAWALFGILLIVMWVTLALVWDPFQI